MAKSLELNQTMGTIQKHDAKSIGKHECCSVRRATEMLVELSSRIESIRTQNRIGNKMRNGIRFFESCLPMFFDMNFFCISPAFPLSMESRHSTRFFPGNVHKFQMADIKMRYAIFRNVLALCFLLFFPFVIFFLFSPNFFFSYFFSVKRFSFHFDGVLFEFSKRRIAPITRWLWEWEGESGRWENERIKWWNLIKAFDMIFDSTHKRFSTETNKPKKIDFIFIRK